MIIKIEVKNKSNILITIIGLIGLIFLCLIIIVILPLVAAQKTYFLSFISYIFSLIPFLAFFIFLLNLWMWNTFGKTVLFIEKEKITIIRKCKLFSKPTIYLESKINKIYSKNFKIEKSKYYTRVNFSLNGSLNSVIFEINGNENRIIDWLTRTKADEIVETINKIWNK